MGCCRTHLVALGGGEEHRLAVLGQQRHYLPHLLLKAHLHASAAASAPSALSMSAQSKPLKKKKKLRVHNTRVSEQHSRTLLQAACLPA